MRPYHTLSVFVFLASPLSAQVAIAPSPYANHDALVSIPVEGAVGFFFDSVFDIETGESSTRIQGSFICESYRLFLISPGTVFDSTYVANHTAIAGSTGLLWPYNQNGVYSLDPGTIAPVHLNFDESHEDHSRLFAFWDDRAPFGGDGEVGVVETSDLFGWMRVGFSLAEDPDSGLPLIRWSILSSAIATGGIVAGQIPEPASFAAFVGAAALTAGVNTRRRRPANSVFVCS